MQGFAGMISSIVRSLFMKIMSSGIRVFFIQKLCRSSFSKMNNIPQLSHSSSLNIRPSALSLGVFAVSIDILFSLISAKFFIFCRKSIEIIRMTAIKIGIRACFVFMIC